MNHIFARCNKINENPLIFTIQSLHICQNYSEASSTLMTLDEGDKVVILNVDGIDAHVGDVVISGKIYDGESYLTDTLSAREIEPNYERVIESLKNKLRNKDEQIRFLEKEKRFIPHDIYGTDIYLPENICLTPIYDEYIETQLTSELSSHDVFCNVNTYDGGLVSIILANKADNSCINKEFDMIPLFACEDNLLKLNIETFNGNRHSLGVRMTCLDNEFPYIEYCYHDDALIFGEVQTVNARMIDDITYMLRSDYEDKRLPNREFHYNLLIKGTDVLYKTLIPLCKDYEFKYEVIDSKINIEYKYLKIK